MFFGFRKIVSFLPKDRYLAPEIQGLFLNQSQFQHIIRLTQETCEAYTALSISLSPCCPIFRTEAVLAVPFLPWCSALLWCRTVHACLIWTSSLQYHLQLVHTEELHGQSVQTFSVDWHPWLGCAEKLHDQSVWTASFA